MSGGTEELILLTIEGNGDPNAWMNRGGAGDQGAEGNGARKQQAEPWSECEVASFDLAAGQGW